jgi:nucleoside-diphosphate-sugar epimerase
MRILITGGTGFIGTNLAIHYRNQGHDVAALSTEATDIEKENARDLRSAGVATILGSVTEKRIIEEACEGTDLVHHIAAAMREANMPDRSFWQVNVDATRQLLDIARSKKVRRFVYCSSIGAMGKSPRKPANEETLCQPEDIYQVTKKAAEELCLKFQKEHRFPLSIVRPADVYGPRDRRLLKLFRAIKTGKFAMIGSGQNEHHMVYIDDLVQGMVLAGHVEGAIGEVFILAGEAAITINRLTEIVASAQGVRPPRIKVPLFPVQAAAVVMEKICKPLGLQPPIYPRRVDFFRSDYVFDISKAKSVLGYEPQNDVTEGVNKTKAWYEERGLL